MANITTFKKGSTVGVATRFKKGGISPRKGAVLSDETKAKISASKKGQASFRGKIHTEETKKNISNKKLNQSTGEHNGNWKGGISKIDKLCRSMPEYKQWRSDVFSRDKWTCQTCRINGVYVTAHHIKGFSIILQENFIKSTMDARLCEELWDIKNGVTLCEECHSLTDNYRGRAKNICQQQR